MIGSAPSAGSRKTSSSQHNLKTRGYKISAGPVNPSATLRIDPEPVEGSTNSP